MAGGSGTRLWPLSRGNFPKQFLSLHGDDTLLQQTISRLNGIDHQPLMVICNEEHRFIAAEQLRQLKLPHEGILLEPVARNTAPAIALAALKIAETNPDEIMLVLPSDHMINEIEKFQESVTKGIPYANQNKLVTFGAVPTYPETGYGYIQRGKEVTTDKEEAYTVSKFVEKPDRATAQEYVSADKYYWNSGMFMFKARVYLESLHTLRPDIYVACEQAMQKQQTDMDFIRVGTAEFNACPADSIDYAVMEKTPDAVVVPLNAEWNDIGSYSALWDVADKDGNGNVFNGDVYSTNTKNTYVHAGNKLIATVGVDNLVIVNTKDAVLIAEKAMAQDVKTIVAQLSNEKRDEVTTHREVYRPWGKYDCLDNGEGFQVKRITVQPGGKLSEQMHHYRSEHWVVVSGTAKVTLNGSVKYVTENESVYIPITAVHALENPGEIPLELIEVQSGSYLGEDDIVRFNDHYGRT